MRDTPDFENKSPGDNIVSELLNSGVNKSKFKPTSEEIMFKTDSRSTGAGKKRHKKSPGTPYDNQFMADDGKSIRDHRRSITGNAPMMADIRSITHLSGGNGMPKVGNLTSPALDLDTRAGLSHKSKTFGSVSPLKRKKKSPYFLKPSSPNKTPSMF